MVVFTCNHCGESLQKPRVEKHYSVVCRTQKFLTCVDCFKDFRGDEYNIHTKCVSEEKRYSGKDYVEKAKKGEVKQESWMEMIKSIIMHESNLKPQHKNLLETISNYSNVPRKRAKFINFIKSSTGGRTNIGDIEVVWDIIEKHKSQHLPAKDGNKDDDGKAIIEDENQSVDVSETPSKKKKKKRDVSIAENGGDDENVKAENNDVNEIVKKKKKKDKECVADNGNIDGNVNSEGNNAAEIGKKTNNNDDGIKVNGNTEGGGKRIIEDENQSIVTSETLPKKKKKKRDVSVAENGADINEMSKKKNKTEDESIVENGNMDKNVNSEDNNITEVSKKKKKKKLNESSVENCNNDSENKLNDKAIAAENCITDKTDTSPKKKKKAAKADLTNLAEAGVETEVSLVESGAKQPKKNKKHKMDDEVIANNTEIIDEVPQKKKKSLSSDQTDEIVENVANEDQNSINGMATFSFEEQINQILMKKQTIKKDKLYKKILSKYVEITGEAISGDKFQKKLNKKLKKADNICIEGDFVKIIS